MNQFTNLPIKTTLLRGIEKKQFSEMTEVQEQVIPIALQKKDLIAQAPTGTGKTLAYAIPILEALSEDSDTIQAIVLSPTRELAVQITEEMTSFATFAKGLQVVAIYGGESIDRQFARLRKKPQVIVATPGRLMDHMRRGTVKLSNVSIVVLDEADEMLNMGFKEDIDTILASIKQSHQTMLFSATMSREIELLAKTYLDKPVHVKIQKTELTVSSIKQHYIDTVEKDKIEIMSRIIDLNDYHLIMVFCNTKKMVDEVTSGLLQRGYLAEALHGDMKQMQRDRVMMRFRSGAISILVASDVAARGLDIDDVDVVFNYDVPTDEEYYVHRVGRTGRAKKSGLSITFVTRGEKSRFRSIVTYSKADITKLEIPTLEKVMNIRIDRLLEDAIESAKQSSNYGKNIQASIRKLEENGVTLYQIIHGLIHMNLVDEKQQVDIQEIKEEIEDRKRQKQSSTNDTRLFITLGKKDQIKIYHLTDLISRVGLIPNRDINRVEIHDTFSFFEIPTKKVSELIEVFKDAKYKGRRINVEVANQKENRGKSTRKKGKQYK